MGDPAGGPAIREAPAGLRLRPIGRGTFSNVFSVQALRRGGVAACGEGREGGDPDHPAGPLALKALHPHLVPTKEHRLLLQEGAILARLHHR